MEGQGAWQEVVREASRTIIAIQVCTECSFYPLSHIHTNTDTLGDTPSCREHPSLPHLLDRQFKKFNILGRSSPQPLSYPRATL